MDCDKECYDTDCYDCLFYEQCLGKTVLFVCTSGKDKVIDMITLDKGLAFKCLNDGVCDAVVETNTDKSYDEVCSIFMSGDVDMTYWDFREEILD